MELVMNKERTYWYDEEDPNHKAMIAKLLDDDVLFCNSRKYICDYRKGLQPETIILMVNCNDVFAWGSADAEEISLAELPELFKMHEDDPKCGSTKWACLKRNEKPQKPMIDWLKEHNAWTDELEKLPENKADKLWEEHKKQKEKKDE